MTWLRTARATRSNSACWKRCYYGSGGTTSSSNQGSLYLGQTASTTSDTPSPARGLDQGKKRCRPSRSSQHPIAQRRLGRFHRPGKLLLVPASGLLGAFGEAHGPLQEGFHIHVRHSPQKSPADLQGPLNWAGIKPTGGTPKGEQRFHPHH